MRGQASVEVITIIAIAVIIAFIVLSRFTPLQDTIFTSAAVRQAAISGAERLDTKYIITEARVTECPASIKINVGINPTPGVGNNDNTTLTANITPAVNFIRNTAGKTVSVSYNDPLNLLCP